MSWSTVAICALFVTADLPAEKFNLSGQHRTRTCVEMRGDFVALRFADGTPTGFWASADDPSQQGSAQPCGPGTMEIDAHERLTSADNLATYFHPGGGPDQYLKNYIENGQYGHIAHEDLKGTIKLIPSENGKGAPVRSGRTYFVTPTRIPEDMWYKPNVSGGKSGARYFTYGNPGYDKTYGRGDWTYLELELGADRRSRLRCQQVWRWGNRPCHAQARHASDRLRRATDPGHFLGRKQSGERPCRFRRRPGGFATAGPVATITSQIRASRRSIARSYAMLINRSSGVRFGKPKQQARRLHGILRRRLVLSAILPYLIDFSVG